MARYGASQRAIKVSIDLAALRHIDDVVLHGGGELDAAHHSEIAQHGEDQDVFHAEITAVKGVAVDLAGERLQIVVDLGEQLGRFVQHLGDACADLGFFFADEIHHGRWGGKFGQAKLDAAGEQQLVVILAHFVCPCLDAGADGFVDGRVGLGGDVAHDV